MKMLGKLFKLYLVLFFSLVIGFVEAGGQNPAVDLPDSEQPINSIEEVYSDSLISTEPAETTVTGIVEEETETPDDLELELTIREWTNVLLQGKLKMQGLPLSPNLRIYMEKDSLIDMSIRAPLIGEVGRLIVDPDSLIAVNKLNKTYFKEAMPTNIPSFGQLKDGHEGISPIIGYIQDLLLGDFFLPGIDLEAVEIDDVTEIFYEDDQFNVIPKGDAEIEGVNYGFVVDSQFRPIMLAIIPADRPNLEIYVEYTRELRGYDIRFVVQNEEAFHEAKLEFKEPEWGIKEPKGMQLGNKYKQMSLGEFVKAIGK